MVSGRNAISLLAAVGLLISGIGMPSLTADDAMSDYLGPVALQLSPDGRKLFVACADARQLLSVDLAQRRVERRVDLPDRPTGVLLLPGGGQLVVTCAAPTSRVLFLDAASLQELASVAAGHTALAPTLSPDGRRLFICNRFSDDVSVIDVSGYQEVARVDVVRQPVAAAMTPDGRSLLVANHLPKMRTNGPPGTTVAPVVTVIDTRTLETEHVSLPSGASSVRGVCVSPNGKYAFVTHILSNFENIPFRVDMGWTNVNVVTVIDLQSMQDKVTIGIDQLDMGAGNPWAISCTADGEYVCVTQAGIHALCVIDQKDLLSDRARRTMSPLPGAWPVYPSLGESLWKRVELPGNGPRALAVRGSSVFVAEYFSDSVTVVQLAPSTGGPAVETSIALGPPPRLSPERLGEMYFNDATICYQHWQSCASCHPDGRVDALNWDLMNDGIGNFKNTKSMLLAHETPPAMAEGVRPTADKAVRAGLIHILFTHGREEEARAMDVYLRSLKPTPSPHLIDGRLSVAAQRGRQLFFSTRVGCSVCHPAPYYTDLKRHALAGTDGGKSDVKLDTPTLVEVWRTSPYLFDGRYVSMHELLADGRHGLWHLPDGLDEEDLHALAEFVLSL